MLYLILISISVLFTLCYSFPMRKFFGLTLGGIQQKIFNMVLVTMIIVAGAFVAVSAFQYNAITEILAETSEEQLEAIDSISSKAMESVFRETLQVTARLESEVADGVFSNVRKNVNMLAEFVGKVISAPESYPQVELYEPDIANKGVFTAQVLFEEGTDPNSPKNRYNIGLMGNVADMMISMISDSGELGSCFIALEDGIMIVADNHPETKILESGEVMSFPIHERPWYNGAVQTGGVWFSDVEYDLFTGKMEVVCSMPVYHNGVLVAVVGFDVFLDFLTDAVSNSAMNAGFMIILNEAGHIIVSPKTEGVFKVEVSESALDLRKSLWAKLGFFVANAMNGDTNVRLVPVENTEYFMTAHKINTVDWTVICIVDKADTTAPAEAIKVEYNEISENAREEFLSGMKKSRATMIILLVISLLLCGSGAILLAGRIVRPINRMARKVTEISEDKLLFEMEDSFRTRDEIEILAQSFANLSSRTVEYIKQITTITAEKERIGAELNVAANIQADMLPRIFPPYPNNKEFDLFASMTPAKEVGGDFYDFFMIDDSHIALVMADVSGKGVPAALFMVIAKTLIKDRALQGGSPAEILEDVNAQLCEGNEASLFVTVWLAIIDLKTGEGMAANAGHEHPALRHNGEEFHLVEYRHSPAVAVMEGMKFRQHPFKLEPGDTLFVYTDGVPEATDKNNRLFGTDRMLEALNKDKTANPKALLKNVNDGISTFIGDAEQFDDTTMLCFHYKGNSNS